MCVMFVDQINENPMNHYKILWKKKQIITAKSHSTAMKNDNSMTIKPQFYHSIPIESL